MLSWMYEPLITVQGLPVLLDDVVRSVNVVVVVSIGGVVLVATVVPFVAGVVRSVNVVDAVVVVVVPRHSGVSAYLGHVRHRTASHCAFSRETKSDD